MYIEEFFRISSSNVPASWKNENHSKLVGFFFLHLHAGIIYTDMQKKGLSIQEVSASWPAAKKQY